MLSIIKNIVYIMNGETEDYLELDSILDSCIVDDGKRWYNVKWKTAWLLLEQLPEEALKDYHCSTKDSLYQEKIYSILEEKVDPKLNMMKYLLCSVNTWEPEDKLTRLYPILLNSYWTEYLSCKGSSGGKARDSTCAVDFIKRQNNGVKGDVSEDMESSELTAQLEFKKNDIADIDSHRDEDEYNKENENSDADEQPNKNIREAVSEKSNLIDANEIENVVKNKIKDEKQVNDFECHECGKHFVKGYYLKMHMRTHTGEKPFHCTECGKHFSQKGTLTVHMRSHTGEKPFKCSYCESTFSCHHYLKCHLSTHTGEKPHKCPSCEKTFSQKGTLTIHLRTHTGEKPFKCVICTKPFSCQHYLKLHMTTHSDEKPYHCDMCTKHFARSDSLKMHMRMHSNVKPFQCKLCEKQFKSSHYLKIHEATHTTEKAYACDQCDKEFSQKGSLMRHLNVHKKEEEEEEEEEEVGAESPEYDDMVFSDEC